MRNLSDTVSRLAALRRQFLLNGGTGTGGQGRLSRLDAFGSNPGALAGWTYIPAELTDAAPLVVVLHGCTQTAEGYDDAAGWSRMADHYGFALLFPEQQRANNPNLCFNWFVPDDCRRDRGEAHSIGQMIASVIERHAIDPARVYINGLSAGGAMTSVMLATYPELFAGGAIIAGLSYDCATTIPEAFDRMRGHGGPSTAQLQSAIRSASSHRGRWPTISIWHGDNDRTVASSNADAIVAQWSGVHGLNETPSLDTQHSGYRRRVWTKAGRDVIEEYRIAGMGHGTPITTGDRIGDGRAAPFMLEATISSTRTLVSSWGLTGTGATSPKNFRKPTTNPDYGGRRYDAPKSTEVGGIRATIETALRAAGLMR